MQSHNANRAATAALAIAAALSLGFAPAVDTGAQSEPASTSEAGKCLEGYAYVEVLGSNHGITSTWCIHPTDCGGNIRVGPASDGTSTAKIHYYVSVPQHTGSDVTCYV